jgi:DtxR family Mn-dependent transcriptional regulator
LASLTVENYVKAIFKVCQGELNQRVTTGRIATEVNVSPGTVTSMLKTLDEHGLATYTPYEGVRLTETGRTLALNILRRHRLIELFLTRVLGMGWDEVHDDAEQMEHVLSDPLIERIDDYLGRPRFDPHGDPIPAPDGTMYLPATKSLAECDSGAKFRLARVLDQSPEFLRYLLHSGLSLNVEGEVVANRPEAGAVTVHVEGRDITLGHEAAQKLRIVLQEDEAEVESGQESEPALAEARPS